MLRLVATVRGQLCATDSHSVLLDPSVTKVLIVITTRLLGNALGALGPLHKDRVPASRNLRQSPGQVSIDVSHRSHRHRFDLSSSSTL